MTNEKATQVADFLEQKTQEITRYVKENDPERETSFLVMFSVPEDDEGDHKGLSLRGIGKNLVSLIFDEMNKTPEFRKLIKNAFFKDTIGV